MTEALLTVAARRHVTRMLKAIAPYTERLDRRLRGVLRRRGFNVEQVQCFLSITPSAAAQVGSFGKFLEQVERCGIRLAKLNVQPDEAREILCVFERFLDALLPGRFEPAREQLHLATVFMLSEAFYRVREAEAQVLFGLYRAEAESHGLDELLERFIRILTRAFGARTGRLLLLDQPPSGRMGHPSYIEHGQAAEKLVADPQMRGRYESYWSVPISASALLQFGFDSRRSWLPREQTLLALVAERCREPIEKERLRGKIRLLEATARRTEEEERRRIGRELHDEACQSLLALRLDLELMEREAGGEMRPRLAAARAVAERTVEELRRIVAALSPAVLERLGLTAAIRQLAARFRARHAAQVRVRISGDFEEVSQQQQQVVYRTAQESLQNIAKHSQATQVNLLLHSTDKSIRLRVSDNGAGFDPETALSKPMSFGLAGMRERARLLAGELAVRSAPGKGVTVLLALPQDSAAGKVHAKNSRITD